MGERVGVRKRVVGFNASEVDHEVFVIVVAVVMNSFVWMAPWMLVSILKVSTVLACIALFKHDRVRLVRLKSSIYFPFLRSPCLVI